MVVEKVFAVIAESTRRDLLEALAQESKSVGQLVDELGISQPTVSKHLRVLREAGVVTMRAQGQKRYYGINTEPLTLVSTWLESLGAGVIDTVVPKRNGAARADSAVTASSSEAFSGDSDAAAVASVAPAPIAKIPASAAQPVPASQPVPEKVPVLVAASVQADSAAEAASPAATSNGTAAVVPFGSVQSGVVQANENDAVTSGQFSRSVGNAGRLANKAADLLSNLPALPTFKRRKS